jgi:hypothetical protein
MTIRRVRVLDELEGRNKPAREMETRLAFGMQLGETFISSVNGGIGLDIHRRTFDLGTLVDQVLELVVLCTR